MDHFEKIAAHLADDDLDALLLTGEANRYYASGFHSAGTASMPRPSPVSWCPPQSFYGSSGR